jgi:soluble lytic murein transglycosylase-like protein
MTRLRATLALMGALATPGSRAADEIYSFVDGAGVIHYTNVPHTGRYHRVAGDDASHVTKAPQDPRLARTKRGAGSTEGLHRVTVGSRAARVAPSPSRISAFDEHIRAAAQKYGLAPPLLKAVMAVESNFNPVAISEKGATGLMQLMPDTARDMDVYDMFDPAQNIEGGARYLRQLQDRFGGDLVQVLAAYNAGPERVSRSGGAVPAIPETQAYVRKVLELYEAYVKGQ